VTSLEARCRLQQIRNIQITVAAFLLRVSIDPKWRRA